MSNLRGVWKILTDITRFSWFKVVSHDEDTLNKHAMVLLIKYANINGQDFFCEILSAKKLIQSLNASFENMNTVTS